MQAMAIAELKLFAVQYGFNLFARWHQKRRWFKRRGAILSRSV